MEENSLPDLPANSVFDVFEAGTSQERAAGFRSPACGDVLCKASVSPAQDAEAIDTHLAGKEEFVALGVDPNAWAYFPFIVAKERPAYQGYEQFAENEDIHLQPASSVLMPIHDSATRISQTSSPIQDVHTGHLESGKCSDD